MSCYWSVCYFFICILWQTNLITGPDCDVRICQQLCSSCYQCSGCICFKDISFRSYYFPYKVVDSSLLMSVCYILNEKTRELAMLWQHIRDAHVYTIIYRVYYTLGESPRNITTSSVVAALCCGYCFCSKHVKGTVTFYQIFRKHQLWSHTTPSKTALKNWSAISLICIF